MLMRKLKAAAKATTILAFFSVHHFLARKGAHTQIQLCAQKLRKKNVKKKDKCEIKLFYEKKEKKNTNKLTAV
jgi:hypothetical protein